MRCSKKGDAIDEHLLLMNTVVEHMCKADRRVFFWVFKNARFLNTLPFEESRL